MTARDTGILLDAQDNLSQARELIDGLRLAGEGIRQIMDRDRGNAVVYIAALARDRIDEAVRRIDDALREAKEGAA